MNILLPSYDVVGPTYKSYWRLCELRSIIHRYTAGKAYAETPQGPQQRTEAGVDSQSSAHFSCLSVFVFLSFSSY